MLKYQYFSVLFNNKEHVTVPLQIKPESIIPRCSNTVLRVINHKLPTAFEPFVIYENDNLIVKEQIHFENVDGYDHLRDTCCKSINTCCDSSSCHYLFIFYIVIMFTGFPK